MNFFPMNPNFKYFLVGLRGGEGARVSEFFSKSPNLKIRKTLFFFWGGGGLADGKGGYS